MSASKKFLVEMPGIPKMLWYLLRYPSSYRERSYAFVTDRMRGVRYQVDDDEDALMDFVSNDLIRRSPKHVVRQFAVTVATDQILDAINDRHMGNTTKFQKFMDMSDDEWGEWWGSILVAHEP